MESTRDKNTADLQFPVDSNESNSDEKMEILQPAPNITSQQEPMNATALCVVCLIRNRAVALVPCGHFNVCVPCGHSLVTCPNCATNIKALNGKDMLSVILTMRSTILLIFVVIKICSSSVIFRIEDKNENATIKFSYLFGTIHVAHDLVWPYLSNETLEILTTSDQIWVEHDFTDPMISKYIYGCAMDKMPIKKRASLRAKSWARFLNETKEKSNDQTIKSNNLERWREWFLNTEFVSNNYLWRNKTLTNDTIFDHRIMLEAYQRGTYVGSLESLPNDCFLITNTKSNQQEIPVIYQIIYARAFNCDMIDEDFVKEIYKGLDFLKMTKRNERITKQIRKLFTENSQKQYVFAVGAAHLFGNNSIVQMLQDQYPNDYSIQQIELASPNFPYQNCTDEEFARLVNEINPVQNKTMSK